MKISLRPSRGQRTLCALATLALACSVISLSAAEPITVRDLGLTLMPIPAGAFTMGSIDGDVDERPVTRVTISSDFWMGKTEVTQGQWRSIMGNNPSAFKGDDQRPVECVSYDDALAFCRMLTERERAAGRLPDGYAYALPTEAQWEYGCRAGTTGQYAGDLDTTAWYRANSGGQTHQVARKQANAWGLHDMHGNVWEWCADWYADTLPGGSVRDYTGASSGSMRTSRGGGLSFGAGDCRSANRNRSGVPNVYGGGLGFRLALAPEVSR